LSPETLSGRYSVERTLGRGGMAIVFLAHDGELDRPVALKVLADNLAGDAAVRHRFLREARLAARISHPNVVTVYDAGDEAERPFIVMEYVDGETLADRLARGRLAAADAVDVAVQLCAALEHAHRAGLVHRDVKPQNVLLRADGVAKLADFGIARAAEQTRLTEAGTLLGTASYLAPELAAGGEASPASDLYSLGVLLYESLTGRLPHEVHSLDELGRKHRDELVVSVRELEPTVPAPVEDAVMRCLARKPEYRPGSAAELASELTATTGRAAPTEPLPRGGGNRRRAWITAAAAAALLCVGAIAAALMWSPGGSKRAPTRAPAVRVAPVARGATPADEAANLAAWLRENARRP
jgi:serine/threonine-protein kinase